MEEFWIKRKRPAVTKVEEWTKEEIGVGAAIAAGSQGENGKRADLVDRETNRRKATYELDMFDSSIKWVFTLSPHHIIIKRTRKQSPNRFIKIVIVPE